MNVARLATLSIVIAAFMLIEARRAARNEKAQRARGAIEPASDVYPLMRIVYPGVFVAMVADGATRPSPAARLIALGVTMFAAGKALKWWAILALGECWTFRVLVVPGAAAIRRGPYRLLRHPNYAGVVGELVGASLIAGAAVAGPVGTLIFVALMAARVRVENRALNAILAPHDGLAARASRHAGTR
jgi:methyltransferase